MVSFSELRPSYVNFVEFVSLGYRREFVNIYLGFLVIFAALFYIFKSRENIHVKFIALYFSLSFFTNFAYQMYGARLFDYVGIVISLIAILIILKRKLKILFFEKTLFLLAAILFLHLLILYGAGYFGKYDAADRVFFQRMVMVLRVFILFFVVLYFTNFVKTEKDIDFIVSTFKYVGMAILFIMMVQEILFFGFGNSTVGLNVASGGVLLPRFASVAIEGGHFGRLLPTFLIYFLAQKGDKLKVGLLFCFLIGLSATNISASFYGCLFFLILSLAVTHLSFCKIRNSKTFLIVCGLVGFLICYYFYDYVYLLGEKVVGLVFGFGDAYSGFFNRRWGFVYKSLSQFPLGIGFGVSNRFLPDGSYTDSGIFAVISQLSALSFVFILFFLYYWHFQLRTFVKNKRELVNKRYAPHAIIMLLATPLIFFFDIVWLYPGYILPFLVLSTYINNLKERPETTKSHLMQATS